MMMPLAIYFKNSVKDFDQLFTSVFDGALGDEDIRNLEDLIFNRTSIKLREKK